MAPKINPKDEWETPEDMFEEWWKVWRFTIDVAASYKNTKCENFYPRRSDGLKQPWFNQRVWCNPPYSNIGEWVDKAIRREADVAVLLVPVWTDRKWFHRILAEVPESRREFIFLPGRVKFIRPAEDKRPSTNPPFPSMLIVLRNDNPLLDERGILKKSGQIDRT